MRKKDLIEWQSKNDWFGNDEHQTKHALLIHSTLVHAGVSPKSRKYLYLIDYYMDGVKHLELDKAPNA
jgi:hypothetical protein